MKRILPLLFLPAFVQASDFATGGTEILLDDGATAVHVFTASGTITLDKAQFAQLLLVGGGGGGGHDCAGGGGGGGVVEVRKTRLPAGTYTVAVGAGGAGCASGGAAGGNGGASSIADGNGTVLYRALGGGGGGGWGAPPPSSSPSAPFASGGGGTNGRSGATTGDPAQGFSGGNSSGNKACPAGGGGAGGPASPETVTVGKGGQSGSGGPGVTSDIAGTAEMYGAGGGGGGYDSRPGTGGDGIGGHGWRYGTTPTGDEPGRDGYGGGGGGGNNNAAPGGNGGSGTVIFRFAGSSATTPEPEFTWDATTVNPDSLVFSVMATSAGTAATEEAVDLFAEVADGADAWDAQGAFSGTRKALLSGAELGLISARAYGLRPSHGYFVRLVLANDGGEEAVSDIRFFTTVQLSEPRYVLDGRTGAPGLYQLQLTGDNLLDAEMDLDSPALTVQRGAVAAGIANHGGSPNAPYNGGYTDENGVTWTIGALINYRYSGWMFLEAGATYEFFGCYWDGVRFDLDGTTRIRTGDYARTFSYACTRTGWHTVDLWFGTTSGRLGVVERWSLGFGWNTNGVTSTSGNPGDGWIRLENGCGGDAYLRTVPEGRTVDIASWSADADAGTATFTAALGESFDDTDLYAVWGPWHGGDATNGWAHVERVGSAAFGTAAATATFVVGDISDLGYFRFVAIDDKPLLSWSPSQLVDLANPAVLIAGVTHDGDRATVSIRVDSVGTGDFSLRLLWGESADLSGASVTNVPTSGPGTYDVTVPVRPGATIYYRVEATTTDGGHDATAIASFTTRAGSVLSETPTASVNRHTVNFSCSLAPAGAGTTAVTLWIGESPDALVADPDPILTSTDVKFTFTRVLDGWPRTYYWKLTCTNAAAGGTSWTDETAVRSVSTTEEGIAYRWAAGSTNGNWTVTNNWTTSTPGALGYPATNYCSASFPNGTEATIDVPAGVYFVRLVFETTGSRIVLRGEGAETTGFATGDDGGAAMSGTTFAFDNLFVEEQDVFDYAFGWDAAAGAVLALTNGAVMRLGGYTQGFFGTNSCLRIGEGSALYMDDPDVPHRYIGRNARYGSHLVLASAGEAFRVEGRASVRRLNLVPPDDEHGFVVRLRGPDAQIKVTSGVLADNYESEWSGLPMLYDADIVFEPMSGGYTNTVAYAVDGTTYTNAVPLVSVSSSGRAFGAMHQAESVGTIRISVDTSSMKRSVKSAKQHFVLWKHGIDTTRVELVPGHGYTLRYTYGWPSVLSAPENEGDLPTGVFGYVPAQAGSLLMLR